MINNGLLLEINSLKGKYSSSRVLNSAIGYKEFYDYLFNNQSLDETVEKIKLNIKEYNLGLYEKGRYGWIFEDIEPIYPIPAKGKLNIWNFEGEYELINKKRHR